MIDPASEQRRARGEGEAPTRAALLDAARECVGTHGVAGTTSRMIAHTAGANLGAITYYFGSKDDLVAEALLGELMERIEPVMKRLQDDSGPTAQRLFGAIQTLVADFRDSAEDVPVYLNALILSTRPGPLAERAQSVFDELRTLLVDAIVRLKAEGVIAGWVEPEAMASLLIATGNGIALQTQLEPDGASVSQLAGQLAGLLLAASHQPPSPGA